MKCESCNVNPVLDKPVSFPGVPMVYALCATCQGAGVIPYDLLVTWVWLGEVDGKSAWARDVAMYHGNSAAQFEFDCANFADKMNEALGE